MNNISKPELYLITTMVSEVILLIIYSRFIIKKQLISLKNIFHYTMRYFMFSLTFIPIYYIVNIINPTEMIITFEINCEYSYYYYSINNKLYVFIIYN